MKTHRFSRLILCFLLAGVGLALADSKGFTVDELGVNCPNESNRFYRVHLSVTNCSGKPLPGIELRVVSGTETIAPGVFLFSTPLEDGKTKIVQLSLVGASALSTVGIEIGFLGEKGAVTTTQQLSVAVPACDCLELVSQELECLDGGGDRVRFTGTVRSRAEFDMGHLIILPLVGSSDIAPDHIEFALGSGDTVDFTFEFTAGTASTILLSLSGHDEALAQCCSSVLALANPCRRQIKPCPVLDVTQAGKDHLALSISDPKVREPLVYVEASLTLEPDSWTRVPFARTPGGPVTHRAFQGQGRIYVPFPPSRMAFYRVVSVVP